MNKICTFLSSSMIGELDEERRVVCLAFKNQSLLREFYQLYVIEEHGSPVQIEKAYLEEVSNSKVFILILKNELRDAVLNEFQCAEKKNLKIFIYIYKNTQQQTQEMKEFIANSAYNYHCNHYSSMSELNDKVINDLRDDLIKSYVRSVKETETKYKEGYNVISLHAPFNSYQYYNTDAILSLEKIENLSNLSLIQLQSLAAQMLVEENLKQALLIIEYTIIKFPEDWMSHHNRALILSKMGYITFSIHSYERALKYNPENAVTLTNLGQIFYDMGNYIEAEKLFSRALIIEPTKESTTQLMLECLIKLEKYETAEVLCERILCSDSNERLIALYAVALSKNNKLDEAFKELNKIDKESDVRNTIECYLVFDNGDFDSALDLINKYLLSRGFNHDLAIKKFYCYCELNQKEKALEWFEEIDRNYPLNASDLNNIGHMIMNKYKEYELPIELYNRALKIEPNIMAIWNNLQFAYGELGEHELGIKACDDALRIIPYDSKTLQNKFLFYLEQEKYEEAMKFILYKSGSLFGNEMTEKQLTKIIKSSEMQKVEVLFKLVQLFRSIVSK